MKGYIHSIETFGALDGPGIRYVIFMQGCFYRCQYCHNPDTWNLKNGTIMSVSQIVNDVKQYLSYIKNGGVTLSGGEPLLQTKFVYKLIKKLKKLGVHVALDTAGSLPICQSKEIIDGVDLVLLDIKALDGKLHETITGFSNDNTLDTLKYCESTNKKVWIRHVVVPELTDDTTNLEKLAKFIKQFKCVECVEIIAFHKMGEYKWEKLGVDYKLKTTTPPSNTRIEEIKQMFRKIGLKVK